MTSQSETSATRAFTEAGLTERVIDPRLAEARGQQVPSRSIQLGAEPNVFQVGDWSNLDRRSLQREP